jgi:polyferredoxin
LYKEIIMLHPRARTMLLLAIPALIIGVVSSLVLIVVMKVASVLQTLLWERFLQGWASPLTLLRGSLGC